MSQSVQGKFLVFFKTHDFSHVVPLMLQRPIIVIEHNITIFFTVNKWLNELEQGFYGSALAYDNALTGGQGDLAKVLHRNVFHGEDDASNARAKRLERYVRRELGCLAATDGKAVREGRVRFSGVE